MGWDQRGGTGGDGKGEEGREMGGKGGFPK